MILGTWRGFDLFDLCLGVNALALVLNENLRKLVCLELWWLGRIYSPQPPNKPLGRLLSMGAPDTVRCAAMSVTPQVSISRYVGRFILISDAQ
jgi:hypothetical protein